MKVAEPRGRLHLRGDVTSFQPVDLVQDDDHRNAELEHAPRDEAIARADPLARGQDEQHCLDVFERPVDRALHVLGERIERPLEARQVGEDELIVAPFAIPKIRRRVVCGLSDTIATLPPASAFTSVDLPTFGRPATATKPDFKPADPRYPAAGPPPNM